MEQIKPVESQVVYTPTSKPAGTESSDSAPVAVKDVAPQFVSPKGNIDPKTGVFVTEVRDTGTGQVAFQYPSKKAVAAYARSGQTKDADIAEKAQKATHKATEEAGVSVEKVEDKAKIGTSALADAVTDGTTDQG